MIRLIILTIYKQIEKRWIPKTYQVIEYGPQDPKVEITFDRNSQIRANWLKSMLSGLQKETEWLTEGALQMEFQVNLKGATLSFKGV